MEVALNAEARSYARFVTTFKAGHDSVPSNGNETDSCASVRTSVW